MSVFIPFLEKEFTYSNGKLQLNGAVVKIHQKSDKTSVACYLEGKNGKQSNIEINTVNLTNEKIPAYLFNRHHEIAALFLSEIIAHEVGHHAHRFKRHGVNNKKAEKFAEMYARA
jgi:hypothetical protein